MLNANEHGGIELVALDSNYHCKPYVYRAASMLLQDSLESLDVLPPTHESLIESVNKGIEVGRELYKQGFGEYTVIAGLDMVIRESFTAWPTNDNASSFKVAAMEAFQSSGFRFLVVDFDNPVDADQGVRTYTPNLKEV